MRMKDVGLEAALIGQDFVAYITGVLSVLLYLNFLSVVRAAALYVMVEGFHRIEALVALIALQ